MNPLPMLAAMASMMPDVRGAMPAASSVPKGQVHNDRHGKPGILSRIRHAKTEEELDALMVEVDTLGASAKTIRKAVRAANVRLEELRR